MLVVLSVENVDCILSLLLLSELVSFSVMAMNEVSGSKEWCCKACVGLLECLLPWVGMENWFGYGH